MSSFVETYDPTIEDCYRKQWVVDEQPCLLEVLDTAGQGAFSFPHLLLTRAEEYTALRDQWIRDGEGFMVVYSIASRSTFDRVEKIVERVMLVKDEASYTATDNMYGRPQGGLGGSRQRVRTPIVIVGNKRDQGNDREVSMEEGRALAQQLGCEFFETSARLNQNVEQAFRQLVRMIKVAKRGPEAAPQAQAPSTPKKKHRKCVVL